MGKLRPRSLNHRPRSPGPKQQGFIRFIYSPSLEHPLYTRPYAWPVLHQVGCATSRRPPGGPRVFLAARGGARAAVGNPGVERRPQTALERQEEKGKMRQSLLGACWGAGAGPLVLGDPADIAGVWGRVWGNLKIRGGGPSSHQIPSDGDGARPGCGGTLPSWGAWSCV